MDNAAIFTPTRCAIAQHWAVATIFFDTPSSRALGRPLVLGRTGRSTGHRYYCQCVRGDTADEIRVPCG
jgi:hypothetical protein